MKKIVIIGSVVLVLILAGVGFALTRGKKEEKAPPKMEMVKRGDFVVKINASGNLESLLSVEIKSNVEGEIETLNVKDGDFVEEGQTLLQIDDEQIREGMKQAQANVDAAEAQLEQAKRSLLIKEKQLDSDLQQQQDSVTQAESSYNVVKATSLQQISQQQTNILNTGEALEQDKITLTQAKITLGQANITLSELRESETAAKVDLDNANSELKRTQELFAKEFVSKKALEDAQASQANAHSRYDTAQKRVQSQIETVRSQQETIASRERAVQIRQTTLEFEKQNLELLKQTRAAQEDQSATQLNIAQTRLKQLQQNIEDEKAISRFSLTSSNANLLRIQSNLKNEEERLGWTTIVAPMSGTIIGLEIEEGEIVTSGRSAFSQSPPLMSIVDLSQMVVKTFINEVDMEKLSIGQKAEILVSAYPNRAFKGEVREIAPSGQSRDNIIYFEVMIAVLGSPKELRPGMTADVDIIVVERKDTLLLSIEAVQDERTLLAQLDVPTSELSRLASRQSVEVELNPGQKFEGTVTRRNPGAERGNVEVALINVGRGVRPGKASVTVIAEDATIPNIPAMLRFGKLYHVMLAPQGSEGPPKGGDIEGVKTAIEVGEQNETEVEILGGVREGDQVLIQAAQGPGFGPMGGR